MENVTDHITEEVKRQKQLSIEIQFTLEIEKNFKLFSYRIINQEAFMHSIQNLIQQRDEQWEKMLSK